MKKPFFSIIIPSFNQGSLLQKAIESVLNQSFKNYEIIVVDNYSTDNTNEIIKSFQKKINFYKIRNHGVIGKSRNIGIKKAKGKWLAFLDSDDIWMKNKLKETHKLILKKNFDIICNAEWISYNSNIIRKLWIYGPYKKNFFQYLLENGSCVSTSASTINREFIFSHKIFFNEKKIFITAEDYDFFLNLAYKKAKFYFLNRPLGIHLFHKQSASSNFKKHRKATLEVLKYHVFKLQKFNKNKDNLWLKINFFILTKDLLVKVSLKNIRLSILYSLIKLALLRPVQFFLYILKIIIKQMFQFFLFYFYLVLNFK